MVYNNKKNYKRFIENNMIFLKINCRKSLKKFVYNEDLLKKLKKKYILILLIFCCFFSAELKFIEWWII